MDDRTTSEVGWDAAVGVVGLGLYLPVARASADALAARWGLSPRTVREELGVDEMPVPGEGDHPVSMAVRAARAALDGVEWIGPEDLDVVLWTGDEHKDFVAQTAAIRIQHEIGARSAWAFDVIGEGVTSLTGLRVARALMVGNPEVRTVLLAGGTRNDELVDPACPATRWMLPSAASGAALLLSTRGGLARLLGLATSCDPELADEVKIPVGGTVEPYGRDNVDGPRTRFRVEHPELVESYLAERLPGRIAEVVRAAMAEAGLADRRPDLLALRHLAPPARTSVLRQLGLGQSASDPLADLGHHGPNDPVHSLARARSRGLLHEGSLVALAASGIGFAYGAAVLRWGSWGWARGDAGLRAGPP